METESLTCSICNAPWTRDLKRGRKPTKCPDCISSNTKSVKPKPKKSASVSKATEEVNRKYNRRVQLAGAYFKAIGEPEFITLGSGQVLETYKRFELLDGDIFVGSTIREKGMSGTYKVNQLVLRKDGSAYVDVTGLSGAYMTKYRAFGLQDINL
jgi:uncharacterized Zn finger protein (UPF0148 family)